MALKKSLVERLFTVPRISASQTIANCRISSSAAAGARSRNSAAANIAPPDPGDSNKNGSLFRRFLHIRSSSVTPPEIRFMWPIGDKTLNLTERIKKIDMSKDQIRLDAVIPPPESVTASTAVNSLTGEDVKKLLMVAQMENVKARLRTDDKAWISYSDLVRVCSEVCLDPEQGIRVASILDQSGSVIVLGNVVFLKPEQVTKAIEGLIPLPYDPRKKEFEQLSNQKSEIDTQADALVRRELWTGLGYLLLQTLAFMRLTFWELSWDVMEPICYFAASIYLLGAYTFFLRTSKEPSFEGFYQNRFDSKQKKLMKANNFDLQRYNELRKIFHPYASGSTSSANGRAKRYPRVSWSLTKLIKLITN